MITLCFLVSNWKAFIVNILLGFLFVSFFTCCYMLAFFFFLQLLDKKKKKKGVEPTASDWDFYHGVMD